MDVLKAYPVVDEAPVIISVFLVYPAGEAQKIDRIMERFAERYCKDNPDVFKTSDGAYLLSFALIMLNTDAHNPMADKKLSLEDFVSMCQYQVLCSSYPTNYQLVLPSLAKT